jgi:hypothetical protein
MTKVRDLVNFTVAGAALLALLAITAPSAQTPLPRVNPNSPITIEWNTAQDIRTGAPAQGVNFRALVDGTVTKSFLLNELTVTADPALTNCGASATTCFIYRGAIPGVPTGTHSLVVRAYTTTPAPGEQADSGPLAFEARVTPLSPSTPRIIITALVGGIQIELQAPAGATGQRAVAENVLRFPVQK